MLNRRGFLKGTGGFGAGLVGWASFGLLGTARVSHATTDDAIGREAFESLIDSWMHLDLGEGAGWAPVQLVEVQDIPLSPEIEQFSIRLRADRELGLEPGVHTLDIGSASLDLYLQPSEGGPDGSYVRADFGLLRSSEPVPEPGLLSMLVAGTALLMGLFMRGERDRESALAPRTPDEGR